MSNNYPWNESGEPTLMEYIRYRPDVIILIKPLQTGHSTDVHGLISVIQPKSYESTRSSSTFKVNKTVNRINTDSVISLLQYKALDSGVTCSMVQNK